MQSSFVIKNSPNRCNTLFDLIMRSRLNNFNLLNTLKFQVLLAMSPWRNRLARSAVNRKVGGSSPPGDAFFSSLSFSFFSPRIPFAAFCIFTFYFYFFFSIFFVEEIDKQIKLRISFLPINAGCGIRIDRSLGAAYSIEFSKPTSAECSRHYRNKLWN